MKRRNLALALAVVLGASFAPEGALQEARADLPGFIVRVWQYRFGGLWRTEYRRREIARWYRHYHWLTDLRLWLKRRAEGVWITGRALREFSCHSHCVYKFPNSPRVWRIWRWFRVTDIRRFRAHYRVFWAGIDNGVLREAAPPPGVVDPLNQRFMVTMDHIEIVAPMEPEDPDPGTPWNENVMVMDETGAMHFLGEPGFEVMPDTAGNQGGYTLATTALSTNDLPPASERITDPPMPVPPGMAEIQPGVIVQWLVDENGNIVPPNTGPASVQVVGPGGPISDLGILQTTATVADSCPIELVQLTLSSLNHTFVGDIVGTLTGPNGNTATMVFRPGQINTSSVGDSSNYAGTYTFADTGANIWQAAAAGGDTFNIPSGTYYNSGAWQNPTHNPPNGPGPNNAFDLAFAGSNAQGPWTLRLTDNAGGDIGNLGSWTLDVQCAQPPPPTDYLDDRVLGGQKHQMLAGQPTGIEGFELDLDESNTPLQLSCWMLDANGEVVGAAPGQVVIGPPADMDGDGVADPDRPIGGPIPMNPTVRDENDNLFPGMAPVDFGVVEEDEPTTAELNDLNARLAAQGIPPIFPPFQWCIRYVRARHIWGIDRRFVMDCWRHHWTWWISQHITLAAGTHRVWLSRVALSYFNYSGHHYVVGLPPVWHMLTLVHVRFFRVCYRVYCPYPGRLRIKIEQIYAVVPNNPDDPNTGLMMLTTESNENALPPPRVLAGLDPDPLPVGPDGVYIETLGTVADTFDMGGGGTGIFDGDLGALPPDGSMNELTLLGNRDLATAMRNNQLQLYCWPLNPDGTVARSTFVLECDKGQGCQLPDEQPHGAMNVIGAVSTPSVAYVVADNFRTTTEHPIRSLCWWGGYFNPSGGVGCTPIAPDNFTVTYYADAGGLPGPVIASFPVAASRNLTPRVLDPGGLNLPEYSYSADHPPVPAAPGQCMWVSVQNNISSSCAWFWNTAPPGDAYSIANLSDPGDYDFAFCLDVPTTANGCGITPLDRPGKGDMNPEAKHEFLVSALCPITRGGPPQIETLTFTEDPAPALPAFEDELGNPMPNPTMTSMVMSVEEVPPCCLGDADSSGIIAFADITSTLSNWGASGTPGIQNPGDADCNGVVNFSDITTELVNWGNVCP